MALVDQLTSLQLGALVVLVVALVVLFILDPLWDVFARRRARRRRRERAVTMALLADGARVALRADADRRAADVSALPEGEPRLGPAPAGHANGQPYRGGDAA